MTLEKRLILITGKQLDRKGINNLHFDYFQLNKNGNNIYSPQSKFIQKKYGLERFPEDHKYNMWVNNQHSKYIERHKDDGKGLYINWINGKSSGKYL